MSANTIEDYNIILSVTECKRLGFFKPYDVVNGSVEFRGRNGGIIGSVGFATDTRYLPVAKVSYTYGGEAVAYDIRLMLKRSNLNKGNGYYYFVCPVTGRLCRNLYLSGGRFMCRQALGVIYKSQTLRQDQKKGVDRFLQYSYELSDLKAQKYRRVTYKGKLTPYGKRLETLKRKVQIHNDYMENIQLPRALSKELPRI